MKIGELAQQTGTPVATVRYYEQQGLLPAPARMDNNYRHYGQAHVQRLQFILRCRSLNMSLAEIAQLLQHQDQPQASCGQVNALLDTLLDTLFDTLFSNIFQQFSIMSFSSTNQWC